MLVVEVVVLVVPLEDLSLEVLQLTVVVLALLPMDLIFQLTEVIVERWEPVVEVVVQEDLIVLNQFIQALQMV